MATVPPPPPPPLLDASNPATSLPPPLTPSSAATTPSHPSPPASETSPSATQAGRSKAQRWSRDTLPSSKSGDIAAHPSFKEVLLAAIHPKAPPAVPSFPST